MTHQPLPPAQATGAGFSSWPSPLLTVEQVSKKLSSKAGETTILDVVFFEIAQG
jgi:hypothetical protein